MRSRPTRLFPTVETLRIAIASLSLLAALVATSACGRSVEKAEPSPDSRDGASRRAPRADGDATAGPRDGGGAGADAGGKRVQKFPLGPLPDSAPFEGYLTMQVAFLNEPTQPPATYNFIMKGKKVRWDLYGDSGKGAATGFRLYDGETRKFFTHFEDRPTVYETSAMALIGDAGAGHVYKLATYARDPKGAVQGIPCNRLQSEDATYRYDVCVATGMPTLPLSLLGSGLALAAPFSVALEQAGQFPLDVTVWLRDTDVRDAGAARKARASDHEGYKRWVKLRVVYLERGLVPGAAFDLPAYPFEKIPSLAPPSTHILH